MTGARSIGVGLLIAAALGAAVPAQEKAAAGTSAWVRAPAAGQTSTPAFVVIDNPTMYELWIVSAATDAAASVELREARQDDPTQTAAVKELGVPAYGKLEMAAAGAQLLLTGLTRPLKPGDRVALSLTTDSGSILKVDAVVRP
jgi:copper(I)-binding protein